MNIEIVSEEEFNDALVELGGTLPTCKKLLAITSFAKWPAHLKQDAYKRLGIHPQVVYIRGDKDE